MTQLAPVLLSLFTPSAHAVWYVGNPVLGFRVDRPADDYVDGNVTLDKVQVNHCGGGSTDVAVNDTLDPLVLQTVALPSGNHCSLTFYWGSAMDLDGDGSLGEFTVRYAESTTTLTLETDIPPVALTPYSVVSGSMSGGSPWLLANIE